MPRHSRKADRGKKKGGERYTGESGREVLGRNRLRNANRGAGCSEELIRNGREHGRRPSTLLKAVLLKDKCFFLTSSLTRGWKECQVLGWG
jgi:hypothetical protein